MKIGNSAIVSGNKSAGRIKTTIVSSENEMNAIADVSANTTCASFFGETIARDDADAAIRAIAFLRFFLNIVSKLTGESAESDPES